jgi:FixJ family two-component response regulator
MNEVEPFVFLVRCDEVFHSSTGRLIRTARLNVQPFSSAHDLLQGPAFGRLRLPRPRRANARS